MSKKRLGDSDSARSANDNQTGGRRSALKRLFASGAAAGLASSLPSKWTRPVVDSVMLPAHAQTSAEPDGDFFSAGAGDMTGAPAWLNWIVPAAYANSGCEVESGCARIRNGVITLVVTVENKCYSGDGQVGGVATVEPVDEPAKSCDGPFGIRILELRGTFPNRILVVDEGQELVETDGTCNCDAITAR